MLHSNEKVKGVPLTSRSGVCWMSQLHTDAVLVGINIAPHVVLSAGGFGQGYAPLQWQAVTGPVCLGIHHGGAACKTHRLGGAVAENELGKGDIRPRMVSGLGKKAKQFLNEQQTACRCGRSMWVQRVFRLVTCETGCLVVERRNQDVVVAEETSDGIHDRPFGSRRGSAKLASSEALLGL
jgi:hypothetical protein